MQRIGLHPSQADRVDCHQRVTPAPLPMREAAAQSPARCVDLDMYRVAPAPPPSLRQERHEPASKRGNPVGVAAHLAREYFEGGQRGDRTPWMPYQSILIDRVLMGEWLNFSHI